MNPEAEPQSCRSAAWYSIAIYEVSLYLRKHNLDVRQQSLCCVAYLTSTAQSHNEQQGNIIDALASSTPYC